MQTNSENSDPARGKFGSVRLALVGELGDWAINELFEPAFRDLGAQVASLAYPNWLDSLRKPLARPGTSHLPVISRLRLPTVAVRPAVETYLVTRIVRFQPTHVLFIKCDDLHALTYHALRQLLPSALIGAFHPDDPYNVRTLLRAGPSHRRALMQARQADYYFTWSRRLVSRLQPLCKSPIAYLPFGCDPSLHASPGPVRYTVDVSFIGNWDEERERWLEPLATRSIDLGIWGTDYWQNRCRSPSVRERFRGGPLKPPEFAKTTASSRINLNLLRLQNKGSTNMRTFEIPCVGGFMLHEASEEAAELFPAGEAADYFSSSSELDDKIRYYLAQPALRERIAARGHELSRRHTYRERARTILEYMTAQQSQ